MRFLAVIPLALLAVSAAGAPAAPPASVPSSGEIRLAAPGHCQSAAPRVADAPATVGAQRLDQLPAGNLDLAVMRQVDGCPEPVTIREGYGATGARSRPATRAERPALPRARLLGR
jgi:hypothetical protein